MYVICVSPYDEGLMFLVTDMGGAYRSENGGEQWELIHYSQGFRFMQFSTLPAFFKERIYWMAGKSALRVSTDKGRSWSRVAVMPWEKAEILHLTAVPGSRDVLLVSTTEGLWRTDDDCVTWKKVLGNPTSEVVILGETLCTLASPDFVALSSDRGLTWTTAPVIVDGREIEGHPAMGLAGAMSGDGALMVASLDKLGIIRSTDHGATWELVHSPYTWENHLVMAPGQTDVIYAAQTGSNVNINLLRSTDGGRNWSPSFRMADFLWKYGWKANVAPTWIQEFLKWGYLISPKGFAVNPLKPDEAFLVTQGELYRTQDGGESWQPRMAREVSLGQGPHSVHYQSIGLEVTSAWGYHFDPHHPARHYITYTDIGFARSPDNGMSWQWAAHGSPWRNTFYDLTIDPDVPDVLYAAVSDRHDIPHHSNLSVTKLGYRGHEGGVVKSTDGGVSWQTPYKPGSSSGLPKQVCTTVILDPKSPPGRRILFAGIYGEGDDDEAGVYKSIDGGMSWSKISPGPGVAPNLHIYRLRMHPRSRNLYCLITGLRSKNNNFTVPGGVWKSTDGGNTWKSISNDVNLVWWSTNFAWDPEDEDVLYVSAGSSEGHWMQGGIYKTSDGGRSWTHVLTDEMIKKITGGDNYEQTMAVAVHPQNSRLVYAGTSKNGLLYSLDGGISWHHYSNFPAASVQSINFDPADLTRVIVTTFGQGVFEGQYIP
jgi:photosystem II stability/assembly factor-like uncharacterized protein